VLEQTILGKEVLVTRPASHVLFQSPQLRLSLAEVGESLEHILEQGHAVRRGRLLWEIPDAKSAGSVHLAGGRRFKSGDDTKQR